MLGHTYESENCSAARALEVVGERWSLLIIRDAIFRGTTRFSDFQRDLGLARNVLATRLERFVDAGLMQRQAETGSSYARYVLTDKGRELEPAIVALIEWGDHWAAPNGPPIIVQHTTCTGNVKQQLICTRCNETIECGEVSVRPGPGFEAIPVVSDAAQG